MGVNSTKMRPPSGYFIKKRHRNHHHNDNGNSGENSCRTSISSSSTTSTSDNNSLSNSPIKRDGTSKKKKTKIPFFSSNTSSSNNNNDNDEYNHNSKNTIDNAKQVACRVVENRRMINNVERTATELYPVDIDDAERLQTAHFVQKEFWGGKCFLAPVEQLLESGNDVQILDVGCGSGVWSLDMATRYPKAEFIGLDIMIQNSPSEIRPKNTNFVTGDVLNGLPFRSNTFDYVFMRNMRTSFTIYNWPMVIDELIRVTKVNGWLEIADSDVLFQGCGPLAKDYLTKVKKKLMTKLNMSIEPMPLILKHINSVVESKPNLLTEIEVHKKEFQIGKLGGKLCEVNRDIIKWSAMNAKISLENLDLTSDEYDKMIDKAFDEFDQYGGYNIGFSIVAKKNQKSD